MSEDYVVNIPSDPLTTSVGSSVSTQQPRDMAPERPLHGPSMIAHGDEKLALRSEGLSDSGFDHRSPIHDSTRSSNTRSRVQPALRFYFEEDRDKISVQESIFICTTEPRPPVIINASNRFTRWTGNSKVANQPYSGLFNIIIGLSIERLDLECIESISFSMGPNSTNSHGPLETIAKPELLRLCKSRIGELRWGLHHQYVEYKERMGSFAVEMEIRTVRNTIASVDPGTIDLHYMELCAYQADPSNDPTLQAHRPFHWSIDVAHKDTTTEWKFPARSTKLLYYDISDDWKFACTLSTMDNVLQMDIWDLEAGHSTIRTPVDTPISSSTPPFYPRSCSQMRWPIIGKFYPAWKPFMVSLSRDASRVAVISEFPRLLKDPLMIYDHKPSLQSSTEKDSTTSPMYVLTPFEEHRPVLDPRAMCKNGKFHYTADRGQDQERELFITCDGTCVAIYSTEGKWNHIRTIRLLDLDPEKSSGLIEHRKLIDGIRARYFSWTNNQGTLLICNLETGLLVSRIPQSRNARFSDDGTLVAVRHPDNGISTRWTESGVAIASVDGARSNPVFLNNDLSEILLPWSSPDESFGRGQLGVLMNATTLSAAGRDRITLPVLLQEEPQFRSRTIDGRQYIYANYGSKLSLVELTAITVKPYPMRMGTCDQRCFEEQRALQDRIVPGAGLKSGFDMPSGLTFRIAFLKTTTDEWSQGSGRQSIAVSVSNGQVTLPEALTIPAAIIGDISVERLEYKVALNSERQEMIVYSDVLVMVWGLPTALDGPFSLLLTWWTQLIPFQVNTRTDWYWTSVTQCPHGQCYLSVTDMDSNHDDIVVDMKLLHPTDAFSYANRMQFLDGILALIEIFASAGEPFKGEIIRYIGHHLNSYPNPGNLLENVLAKICQSVTRENYSKYAAFLHVLLDSPHGRWVPRPDFVDSTNPICILLELAEKIPRVIDLLQVLIRYCTRMASKERDLQFVFPLMSPLYKLLEQKQLYSEVTRNLLRGLAFIPAKDRAYIIDHHFIAHPPGFRLQFWRPNQQKLLECKSPVLQMDRSPLSKEPDPQNDNFSSDLFVASFDMLWRVPCPSSESNLGDFQRKSGAQPSQSWVSMIFHMIKLNLKLKSRTSIKCNDFALESLDNPAIVALVEYKWNTIGFTYWLYRFFFQCIYYVLVLTAVFMQVYSSSQRSSLFGVFITIIVLSVVFLWFELVQLAHNWHRFFSSPYNYADVATFVLPLAGSILQLFNIANEREDGQVYLLSFSVLFIFIHFLFELRISKTVCHFVTIIIRIMGEIRVFFLVFSAGVIAFTIAILHMLHACPTDDCVRAQSKFPLHFFGAFSSTYFFMGGRYDSVSSEFEDQEWSFHVMMIIYFFFTAILLLNVLIALINVAFEVGDNSWRLVWLENRLAYVESAENMTYHIPGFRQAHNWFPKEIYYSSTISEVREYQAKHLSDDEGTGASHRLFGQDSKAKATPDVAANKFAAILALHQEGETKNKEFQQEVIESMRKELQLSHVHLTDLQLQFRDQERSFKAEINELKELLLQKHAPNTSSGNRQ